MRPRLRYDRTGKSTLTSKLSDHFDTPSLELGDYVRSRQAVDARLSSHTSTAYEQLRVMNGREAITGWILGHHYWKVVISGVRDAEIFAALQMTYQSAFCIWVESPIAARQHRPRRRGALELCLEDDDRIQRGWGIEEIRGSADLIITNDSSLSSYLCAIDAVAIPTVKRFLSEEIG